MKQIFIAFGLLCSLCAFAQPLQYPRAIVASGGVFEFSPPISDYVTVKEIDGTGATAVIGTIYTQSVQQVLAWQNRCVVSAQDSIVLFKANELGEPARRLAAFGIPDSYGSFHTLYTQNNTLWAGEWYGGDADFLHYYDLNTNTLAGSVSGVSQDVRGILAVGDTLYVTQNIMNAAFSADSVSYIAKIYLPTRTLVGTMGQNDPRFLSVSQLGTTATGEFFGIRSNTNQIVFYKPQTGAVRTMSLGTGAISKLLHQAANQILVLQDDSPKQYDIATGQLLTDMTCLVPVGESCVAALPALQNVHGNMPAMLTTTDYSTYGKLYRQTGTCATAAAQAVGVAPEAMTVLYSPFTATDDFAPQSDWSVSPNPTSGQLRVSVAAQLLGAAQVRLCDVLGRVLLAQTCTVFPLELNLQTLPNGVYFLQMETNGVQTVRKIQKIGE